MTWHESNIISSPLNHQLTQHSHHLELSATTPLLLPPSVPAPPSPTTRCTSTHRVVAAAATDTKPRMIMCSSSVRLAPKWWA
jgi:hypothetical protein